MAAPKVYFGVANRIKEIPAPESGMGFVNANDIEVTPLVSGGRAVYRAPLTYKTHSLSWRTSAAKLQHIVDCYNGQWGSGPFYITDPTAPDLNVLPARWSLGWQLAYQANGWCKPYLAKIAPGVDSQYVMATNLQAVFTQAATGTVPVEGILRTRVIKEPGKPYYLTVSGSATGGAGIRVRGYNTSTGVWDVITTVVTASFGTPVLLVAAATATYSLLELDFYMPLGSTMTVRGMQLATINPNIPGNVLATNGATNPEAVGTATGFAVYSTGTGEAGTTTYVTGASDGPIASIKTYARYTVTTAKTAGSTGWVATSGVYRPVGSGKAGDYITVSLWLRSSVVTTVFMRASAYTAGGSAINSADSSSITLPAGQWVRISATVRASADFGSVGWWAYQTSGAILPVGATYDATGVLSETQVGVVGNYFSGATPNTTQGYYWTGAPNASTSVKTDTLRQGTLPVGQGVGPVQFSGDADGRLTSKVIDRIGLSVDLVEVQNVGA